MRFPPVLLALDELAAEQRCQLVDSLFRQHRSLIQGSIALVIVLVLCAVRTGSAVFGALGVAVTALLLARLALARAFHRRSGRHPPEVWAGWFTAGGLATGAVWGGTSAYVLLCIDDAPLHLIVVMVQAGWVAGLAVRNAVSPATVLYQTVATLLPTMAAFLVSSDPLYKIGAFFFLVQISANLSVARYLGERTVSLLRSEQRSADTNEQLRATCLDLSVANTRLEQLSSTDGLTGICNRRAFDGALKTQWESAARDGGSISLLVIDVDLFKAFNDLYGHPAGDDCLRAVSSAIKLGLRRPTDLAARFGGEEFVALLPATDADGAMVIAAHLRSRVMESSLDHQHSPFGIVTISIGAATARPSLQADPSMLIEAADRALYRAKQAGRNRCEASPPLLVWPQLRHSQVGAAGGTMAA